LGELLAPRTFTIKLNLQIYFQSYAPALDDFKANSTFAVRRGETQNFYLGVFKDQDLTDQVLLDLITELPPFLTLSVGEKNYKPGMDVKNKKLKLQAKPNLKEEIQTYSIKVKAMDDDSLGTDSNNEQEFNWMLRVEKE